MKSDCKTFIRYGAGIMGLAFAFAGLTVGLVNVFAPAAVQARFESTDTKLTEFLLASALYAAIGFQLFLFFYLPTSRRLALKLIYWGCSFCVLIVAQLGLASLKIKVTPEPEPGKHWLLFEVGDSSLSFAGCAAFGMALVFVYLIYCKYQALDEAFLADVENISTR